MTGPEIRAELAAVVANLLPPEWTIYPGIPEAASLPAAIVAARAPYRRPSRFGIDCITYGLTVTLLEARSAGTEGFDSVDVQSEAVRHGLAAVDGLRWESTDQGIASAPGGVDCIGAVLNLELET